MELVRHRGLKIPGPHGRAGSSPAPGTNHQCYTTHMHTQYVHTSRYGGNVHTRLPQYMIRGNAVYATAHNRTMPHGKALYTVKGKGWYATANHPDGKSTHALYHTRGDKVHTTRFHPAHNPVQHAFEIRSSLR